MKYIYSQKDKYDIMIDGLSLVKPELTKEWLEFINNNYIEEDGKKEVIDSLLLMLALTERGMDFSSAEQFVYEEQYDGVPSICSRSIGLVTHFSKRGDEYLEYIKDRESYKSGAKSKNML